MSEKPREDIQVQPEYSYLQFGDGYKALIGNWMPYEDEKGIKMMELTIYPTEILRKRYDIKDSALTNNGSTIILVKRDEIIPLNPYDDANKIWLYLKNWNHQETEIGNYHYELLKKLEEERTKRIIVEAENIWYSEQMALAKTNPGEFLAQGLEFFQKISSNMVDAMRNKQEKPEQ